MSPQGGGISFHSLAELFRDLEPLNSCCLRFPPGFEYPDRLKWQSILRTNENGPLDPFSIADDTANPEQLIIQAEDEVEHQDTLEKLTKAMESLLPQQKELFQKVYLEKRSNTDIAAEEGVTEAAIRGRLKKLQERLRKILS